MHERALEYTTLSSLTAADRAFPPQPTSLTSPRCGWTRDTKGSARRKKQGQPVWRWVVPLHMASDPPAARGRHWCPPNADRSTPGLPHGIMPVTPSFSDNTSFINCHLEIRSSFCPIGNVWRHFDVMAVNTGIELNHVGLNPTLPLPGMSPFSHL